MSDKEEKNKKILFNDDEEDDEDISKIKINKEFAQRYLHNKKREDLHRLEELKKKGAISSSDSDSESKEALSSSADESSDSDDYLNLVESSSTKQHQQFFDALLKVKKKDPVLKQNKDIKLFQDEDEQQERTEESNKKNKKESKSLYLKDVLAKQLIEEGPEFNDEDINTATKKTYAEEQEELRKEFLTAAAAVEAQNDKDNEFFSLKDQKMSGTYDEDSDNEEFNDKLDEYFGKDDQLDDKSRFLKEFFSNKLWLDNKDANDVNPFEEEDLSEDEREVERQEEYEYRFQENAGDRVLGHSRKIEGSVRNKKNARKEQRERKHERDDMEEKARKDELKHLKNLKKQEMQEKLNKIVKTAGIGHLNDLIPLTAAEIEDDFDPDEYDKMMKKAFDEKYYDAEDADPEFCSDNDDDDELKKPDSEKEDELLGLSDGWDDRESRGDFSSLRERILEQKDDKHADNEENVPQEEVKCKRKRKVALLEKAKEAMMDEYYKLDYEDTIGDLKTRFKYAKIKPNRYGMTPADILLLDDNELNQYVSLKKIAPYREKEWKLNNQKRFELKTTVKNRLRDWKSVSTDKVVANKSRDKKSKSTASTTSAIENESQSDEANGEIVNTFRKGSRKKHAVPTQLPLARLLAYGKIPSKSKVNKKQKQCGNNRF